MATASPEAHLHDTSPHPGRPYTPPARPVRILIRVGGALIALLAIVGLPALTGITVFQAHAGATLAALAGLGLYMGRVDHATRLIPNWSVAALGTINLGALLALLITGHAAWVLQAGVVTLIAVALMLAMHLFGGTGMGDVKLITVAALALGAHGPGAWALAIGSSYVLAGLIGAVPALLREGRGARLAMAPYLVAGHALALLAVLWHLAS